MTRPFSSDAVAALIQTVADREILPRFRTLRPDQIREKSAGDLVTDADLAAERALAGGLTTLLPGAVVVGEESSQEDAAPLGRLAEHRQAWVIDPLDGTRYFARGAEPFGVIVALVERGQTVAGWIYMPVSRVTAYAERGGGVSVDGIRITLPTVRPPLANMRGALYTRLLSESLRQHVESRKSAVEVDETHTCAALRYIDLVRGREQFSLSGRTLPWDHAAGVLMWEEAGGVARRFDGQPYDPADQWAGLLLAPDESSWNELRTLLLPPRVKSALDD